MLLISPNKTVMALLIIDTINNTLQMTRTDLLGMKFEIYKLKDILSI